jgi:hypothetical protein
MVGNVSDVGFWTRTWLVHFATIMANVTIAQAVKPNRSARLVAKY